ncbi:cellulase family glycosylhydrolase [Luteolibacter marinus]|uniref:cellulase family glycosylhydrolase n=1 Tax=Luteolibacter marinus TaxID=2776705 RepID=UPI0018668E11|nr:cellulase family glycosylhydrolase [Luteolibacter marinus]
MKPELRAVLLPFLLLAPTLHAQQWTAEQANQWAETQPWRAGSNFAPSYAINQLEMWQADTFDLEAIDRELGYAAGCGMNAARVFLHNLLWEQDSKGLLERMDRFLAVADKHKIGIMFVLFDDVWDPSPKLGKQRAPKPHVHNSGWVQSPGKEVLGDPAKRADLEPYVKGVLKRFKDDKRVIVWDLYNEPGNPNKSAYGPVELADKPEHSLDLVKKCFEWAWEVRPSQPLTIGVWTNDWSTKDKRDALNAYQLDHSDIITFHAYADLKRTREMTEPLFAYGRPVMCTEYMARTAGSLLVEILPYFKEKHVGAFQWGLVAGKTQTQYPWESWKRDFEKEPDVWFHELFHKDGKPYDPAETDLYKQLTSQP